MDEPCFHYRKPQVTLQAPALVQSRIRKEATRTNECYHYLEKLEIIQNPGHPEYEDSVEWLGESYDPEQFNPDLINERLRHLR